jgi:hypothetical protein
MRAFFWFLADMGWFLATATLSLLVACAVVATPIWLGLIYAEVQAIRAEHAVCDCHCGRRCDDDGPGPVLPRVLPRLRNLREEGGE